ncbi:lasso peptide biosynthesis B2 protein [Lentzea sp. NPDC034063]|uniref:lasso peptide biosynthesis B2 protein n=1 Tax=unclassified Lentzea TaxID=2643253 RepID=UPI0033DA2939
MPDFVVPPTVHVKLGEGGDMVLLNTHTGQWHLLNTTGRVVFDELRRSGDLGSAVTALEVRFPSVEADVLRTDVDRLVTDLVERDLLRLARRAGGVPIALPEQRDVPMSLGSRVLTVACLLTSVLLLRFPLRVSIAVVLRLKRHLARRPATVPEGLAVLKVAHAVSYWFPGRVACMELSLTTVLIGVAQRRGLDWCFGHSRDPLTFHSWVETQGVVVQHGDDEPVSATYQRVLAV